MFYFFFNDTATTEIYTLSLHDALPIFQPTPRLKRSAREEAYRWYPLLMRARAPMLRRVRHSGIGRGGPRTAAGRSEEHTSELQSRQYLVCRLLLEKKKHNERTATLINR